MCNRESSCKRERRGGWIPIDNCLPLFSCFVFRLFIFYFLFFSPFFSFPLCCRPTWKCLHKHHIHIGSVTHTHGDRFDCTRQGINTLLLSWKHGKCTPTMNGHGRCLHNRIWVNAHPWHTAMDVAFIKSKGACTPTAYSMWVFRRCTAKVKQIHKLLPV